MLKISSRITIPLSEITITPIRAQGAGGQHVNKVSSAIHLRFVISSSSLPEACKQRLLQLKDNRITQDGVIIIKSQQYRSQEKNKTEALSRLQKIIKSAVAIIKKRKATKPSRASIERRLTSKVKRSFTKKQRGKVSE